MLDILNCENRIITLTRSQSNPNQEKKYRFMGYDLSERQYHLNYQLLS